MGKLRLIEGYDLISVTLHLVNYMLLQGWIRLVSRIHCGILCLCAMWGRRDPFAHHSLPLTTLPLPQGGVGAMNQPLIRTASGWRFHYTPFEKHMNNSSRACVVRISKDPTGGSGNEDGGLSSQASWFSLALWLPFIWLLFKAWCVFPQASPRLLLHWLAPRHCTLTL